MNDLLLLITLLIDLPNILLVREDINKATQYIFSFI